MEASVKPVPDGYHTVTPYLIVDGEARAIDVYKRAFGAAERFRYDGPAGAIMHAELQMGDSVVMAADEFPEMGFRGPQSGSATPVSLLLYVPDVDALLNRAVGAGAQMVRPVQDQFYGERSGTLKDPFGHVGNLATHVEDVPEEEMRRRMENAKKG